MIEISEQKLKAVKRETKKRQRVKVRGKSLKKASKFAVLAIVKSSKKK